MAEKSNREIFCLGIFLYTVAQFTDRFTLNSEI